MVDSLLLITMVVLAVVALAVILFVLWRSRGSQEEAASFAPSLKETPAPTPQAPPPMPSPAADRNEDVTFQIGESPLKAKINPPEPEPKLDIPQVGAVPVDIQSINPTLDWYVLRHLVDQSRMPQRQNFLEEDREHNAALNRYAIRHLAMQGIELQPVGSTMTVGLRPNGATHYIPRYFPDDELDSALVMFKHELIANRLISTIAYLHRLRDTKAQPLDGFPRLLEGNTPFVPDAYVAFYNDLLAVGETFDHEEGICDKIRVLAVRMVFPSRAPEVDVWRERGHETFQVPLPIAREAVTEWFCLSLAQIPLAVPRMK